MDYLLAHKDLDNGVEEGQIVSDLKFAEIRNTLNILQSNGILKSEPKTPEKSTDTKKKKTNIWKLNPKLRDELLERLRKFKEVVEEKRKCIKEQSYECQTCRREFSVEDFTYFGGKCDRDLAPLVAPQREKALYTMEDIAEVHKVVETLISKLTEFVEPKRFNFSSAHRLTHLVMTKSRRKLPDRQFSRFLRHFTFTSVTISTKPTRHI
eukprot:TRINITY_DN9104_c0_g1_i16.p1 TRINITY_DN9104_c0_g1~~TRINITY_DN9104_c0_g1_i16.p1  ORF type:complete len:209 (-),score=40.01 TRINITY_DN9104_c0_g1_i16:223-849(-)